MGAYIDAFMHATAWAMEKPTPYGAFHLAYTFVWLVCGHGFVYPGRCFGRVFDLPAFAKNCKSN